MVGFLTKKRFMAKQTKKVTKPKTVKKTAHKESASITFSFDNDMKVKLITNFDKKFIKSMLKVGVIDKKDSEDETIIHYGLVVLAKEVTEQILNEFTSDDTIIKQK